MPRMALGATRQEAVKTKDQPWDWLRLGTVAVTALAGLLLLA